MLTRVNKVLIGKDIDRTSLTANSSVKALVSAVAEGEILVLDKNKRLLSAGATITDTDTIFLCQATGKTFSYTNEAGTTTTGAKELIFSDPIQGKNVRSYKGRVFTAKQEQASYVDLTGLTAVLGTEYLVRIIYKDMEEYPSQFTQTYRYIATAADVSALDTFGANLAAKINSHSGRRVVASYATATDILTLTGLPIPECTTGLTDIDEFKMVEFEVRFLYVASDGEWTTIPSTSTTVTTTGPTRGNGNWEQIRDMEKEQFAYRGVSNFTQFPVITPTPSTVKGAEYSTIVIEYEREYLSPGINSYQKTPLTLVVALPVAALQKVDLLGVLNPWMASCPGAFDAVAI